MTDTIRKPFQKEWTKKGFSQFSDSIVYVQDEVKEIAEEFDFKDGNFASRPIKGLVKYHSRDL